MRHGKKFNHLGRTASHRKAMLQNMANSLLMEKRIFTTVAKAKALRKFVEPLITRAKDSTQHNQRTVYSYLQDKIVVQELFERIAPKVGDRPGGYTRILKTGRRLGDNADMCLIELVDYNEAMLQEPKSKTRRGRKKKTDEPTPAQEEAPKAESDSSNEGDADESKDKDQS